MNAVWDIIIKELGEALSNQRSDGSFHPGHNGPYRDPETPVRNTSHWLYTLCWAYVQTGKKAYHRAAEQAIGYLLSEKARPMAASFWIRKNPKKDFCNGLMGQAWVLEALLYASRALEREDCYAAAEEVYFLHHFDPKLHIWNRLNVDGSQTTPDVTFNHQLWFAATAGMLHRSAEAKEASKSFFERKATKVRTYSDGIINHVSPVTSLTYKIRDPKKISEGILGHGYYHISKGKLRKKASGYHAFNLYAFALLKNTFPNHDFWSSNKFKKMYAVTNKRKYKEEQIDNKYSYPYNPTGLEMAFVNETFFPENEGIIKGWLNHQIEHTAEPGQSIMTRNSYDPLTSRARIYECCRLINNYDLG
nr:hypothetical protein [Saprospiraceae bacterium]